MTRLTLTKTTFSQGVWIGCLSGVAGEAPTLDLLLDAERLGAPVVTAEGEGIFRVQVEIPADRLSDGVQTFVITTADDGTTLATISVVCGAPLADDIRAEIDLLRGELDMLKRAFRRHCVETGATEARPSDEA
ncbi:hypothetical protein EU805_12355 [Salipiger sp. IMCC34102]|uniref:hypothetical protein n=1 Tax=Salipiger sp. IMCC34102 TaxID=2510647 RepID=UPI00101C284E|nr:hypothetical protein [Salipiger sp. IMCC34102]RYH01971.1 hypothetical protein EU805_12355 [Salipiger sp. IMCC34102]